MTQLQPGVDYKDVPEDDPGDGTFITKVHTYSDSMPQALARSGLESIPAWDTMFPALARLSHRSDLNIDIIHVEASLELRYGPLPDRSELWGKLEIVVPGRYDEKATWQCVQTMRKPLDLYGPSNIDPPYEEVVSTPQFLRHDPLEGTSLRVSVPASSWAFALQRLSMMEAQFREAERSGTVMPVRTTARQYIEQITMYQEIFCSDGPGEPFILKAILLWTFRKCQSGEEAKATWRYVTPAPARSECFSPHPGSDHIVSAVRNENFGAWANHLSSPIRLGSAPAPFDSMSTLDDYLEPGTAPASAGVHFSFDSYGNPLTSNASFMSHTTQHSGSTLVDDGTHSSYPLDGFLSHESAMGSFENPHQMWDASLMESYDPVPRLSTPYGPAQTSSLRQPWDVPISKPSDWPSDLANVAHSDMNLSLHNLATAARSINML
jgi:transcriptional enhancer factor